ncbi:unnamed protein product, partial [Symbiodinium sp. KB8]
VDPEDFQTKFGEPIEDLHELVAARTVNIAKLMEIAPEGTIDPTPSLYNSTMYSMAGILSIAFVCNQLMRPVEAKHFDHHEAEEAKRA